MEEQQQKLTSEELSNFSGTENYYKLTLNPLVRFTDGCQYVAEKGKAFWLMDIIASYNTKTFIVKYPFQVWKLKVNDNEGLITMQEDSDKPFIVKQKIPYTDFPLSEITFYCIDGVCLLTSEY